MKIISNLIDKLSEDTTDLTSNLISTKVLAHRLNNLEFKKWIDFELNGYGPENVPSYRIVPCEFVGTFNNGRERVKNYPIPLDNFDKELVQKMRTIQLKQSVSTLYKFSKSDSNKKMVENIPSELYGYLNQMVASNYVIEFASRQFYPDQVLQVITSIKSKLLDFLLELDREYGNIDDMKVLGSGAEESNIKALFRHTVIGDNATFIVGNNNTQSVTHITKGDLSSLEKKLQENGVSDLDISDLKDIIDTDEKDDMNQRFGNQVKNWISNMISKSMDGAWNVGIGAAGALLSEVIKNYYGWK